MAANGRLMFNIKLAVYQREREATVERVKSTLECRRASGKRIYGCPRCGLDFHPEDLARWEAADGDGKKSIDERTIPNSEEQAVIQRMKAEFESGMSLNTIAASYNADAIPTKVHGRWSHKFVGRVLEREGVHSVKRREAS